MDETVAGLPKAVLHDHLDGGLRVETILELADNHGYTELPAADPDGLARWFHQGDSGSLEPYLDAFVHTVGVLQTADALERVAYEAALDLSADGVVYAEIRFGPSLHMEQGLSREDAIEAVLAGLGSASADTGIVTYLIVAALRQFSDSLDVARAATRFAFEGVVAFDLAGHEAGHPADDHLPAVRHASEGGLGLTIHAGEGEGPNSIWRAIARCGAQRIGHGVRIVEDTQMDSGEIVELGALARRVRDQRIPLEICVTSNLHTGIADVPEHHPLGALHRAGFLVTINTDNRLMSAVTMNAEYQLARDSHGLSVADLGQITEQAIVAGFGDWAERERLISDVVRPGYKTAQTSA